MTLFPSLTRELEGPSTSLTARIPTWALLVIGGVLTLLTGPRWPVPILAWLAPVPYLLVARRLRGWRSWFGFAGLLLAAATAQLAQIATTPVPLIAVLGFGAPLGLIWFLSLLAGEQLRRQLGETMGVLGFATATTVLAWAGYTLTELGAWMSPSVSQVDQLGIMQLASIGGLPLLDFLMGATAGAIAMLIAAPRPHRRAASVLAIAAMLIVGLGWSAVRLTAPPPSRNVIVGAVVTDVGLDAEGHPPTPAKLAANTDALFERTRFAASRGARLVVWNEVATLVTPAEESGFVARAQRTARELHIDLVLGYAVVTRNAPLLLDNKYRFISDTGDVLDTYQKHHPVPGEPSIRGEGPLVVLDRPYAKVGAAICYDYDFPALAREHAARGAELVVVPSSDWRGIDPVHTQMARVRAIEHGFSLVRSTRWAASGAFDGYGRTYAWMPTTQSDFVMMATVPIGREATLYNTIGDAVAVLACMFLVGGFGFAWFSSRRDR